MTSRVRYQAGRGERWRGKQLTAFGGANRIAHPCGEFKPAVAAAFSGWRRYWR
jgi:hypothetical protein